MRKFLTMCLGLALLAVATPPQVFGQQGKYEVKGVVVDATGTPVIGASVFEQDTTNGVTTDINGQYQLNVKSPDAIVVVSFIGYKPHSCWLRRTYFAAWSSKRITPFWRTWW